jgi:hypothetical protein
MDTSVHLLLAAALPAQQKSKVRVQWRYGVDSWFFWTVKVRRVY